MAGPTGATGAGGATGPTGPGGSGASGDVLYLSSYAGVDPTGVTASNTGVQNAFNAAAAAGTKLINDCTPYIQTGATAQNTVFVPPNLYCVTLPGCYFIADSIGIPAFAAIDCSGVIWQDFALHYIKSPVSGAFGDQTYATVNTAITAFNAHGGPAATYMTANCGVIFGSTMTPGFSGLSNACAVFYLSGSCTNWHFRGNTSFAVPQAVNASNFIPVAMTLSYNWLPNQTVANGTPNNNTNSAYPSSIHIDRLTLDGVCMGLVGSPNSVLVDYLHSIRYSDIQTTAGTNVGTTGVGGGTAWTEVFSPPHAYYVNSDTTIVVSQAANNHVLDGVDEGIYVGTTLRRLTSSGYINSIKFEPGGGSTFHMTSCRRVDGFTQALANGFADGSISCDEVILDTSTLITGGQTGASFAMVFPSGTGLNTVKIRLPNVIDIAATPAGWPIQHDQATGHQNIDIESSVTVPNYPSGATYVVGYTILGTWNTVRQKSTFQTFTNTNSYVQVLNTNASVIMSQYCDYEVRLFGWPTITAANILSGGAPRVVVVGTTGAANTTNNRVHVVDLENQYDYFAEGAVAKTSWTQEQIVVPTAGATYTTALSIPSQFAVEYASASTIVNYTGGTTSFNLGWSGSASALLSTVGATINSQVYLPLGAPISLGGSNRTLLMTAVGANFSGTGSSIISVKASTTGIAG